VREAIQEAGHGAGTDGEMATDAHVTIAPLPRFNLDVRLAIQILSPKQTLPVVPCRTVGGFRVCHADVSARSRSPPSSIHC
jgi:hypothetical protein